MSFRTYCDWIDHHREVLGIETQTPEMKHPGQILEADFLKRNNLSQTDLARKIGCTHAKINEIIRGKRGITPSFALDLEKATSIRAETWMRLQVYSDLHRLRNQ